MVSHYEDDALDIELPALRDALDFFEIRPNSNVYGYFYDEDQPTPKALAALAQRFDASFYLLYRLDGDEVVDFDTRVVPIVEHEVQVAS